MKIQTNPYNEPIFTPIPGVNTEKLDYNKSLKNKKTQASRRYILDIYQIKGTKPDRVFRPINAGSIGDIYKKYENFNFLGNGEMTVYLTKISNIGELPIPVKKGDIVEIKGRVYSSNGTISFSVDNGQYRVLFGDALYMNKSHNAVTIVITKDGLLNAQYGDYENNIIISLCITIS